MLLYAVRKINNKGFTLIEMLTVVIIVGVLSSIAAPNFLGLLNQNRVKQGLADVEGAIKESQRLSIRRGKACQIRFTSGGTGNRYAVVQVRPDNAGVSFSGCLLSNRQLPSGVTLSLVAGGGVVAVNSTNVADLGFSGKGYPNIEGIMVVSHPNTDAQKCIQIEGLLGNILTGDFNSTTNECEAK